MKTHAALPTSSTRHASRFTPLWLTGFLVLSLLTPLVRGADTFSTTGTLATPRRDHTATVLQNGKVLVVGGSGNTGYLASAELYDPASHTWTTAGAGTPNTPRAFHTATLLPSGKVLVVGGFNNGGWQASAEL